MNKIEQKPWTFFGRRRRSAEPHGCSLEIENLSFTDDDGCLVLDGAELALSPGSKTCVVGSTGRDQAALLGLTLGLHRPDRGRITIDDRDVAAMPLETVRGLVAIVPADPWLVAGTVADNISFGHRGVSRSDIETVGHQIGIDEFVDRLPKGYQTPVSNTVSQSATSRAGLTDGQRRRIVLARALIRNPGVLLLEEPTTDLDIDEERLMIRAIDAASHGRTTMMVTHRLSLARRSDAVVVITGGRIEPYRSDDESADHHKLWDLRVPPLVAPAPAPGTDRSGLPPARADGRNAPTPASGPWGITIGTEMAPGHLASGLLGRNVNTETWVAWSVEREEPVRIKVPREDPVTYAAHDQLSREHKTLKALDHPALAAAHHADLDAEMPYAIFEYLDSTSLDALAKRHSEGMDPLDILCVGFELAGAISHLHQQGYVHLDLRPRTVRTRQGSIVITDLTHCRRIGAPIPAHLGPAKARRPAHRYRAPESLPGRAADPKMDVYALGALMHRTTAGPLVARIARDGAEPAPYETVTDNPPGAMAEIVDGMLARDPADRPEAHEVLSEFRRILPRSMLRPPVSTVAARSPRLHLVGVNN